MLGRVTTLTVAVLCVQLASGLLGAGFGMRPVRSTSTSSALNANAPVAPWTGGKDQFVKYQGLGNDFILVDNRGSTSPIYTPEQAVKLCDRNFGIGADGLIFALPGLEGCDYTMRIYNSDGTEPQMCGNGIRCMAKFLQLIEDAKVEDSDLVYKIWTDAGVIIPSITVGDKVYKTTAVSMGNPHSVIFVDSLEAMDPPFSFVGPLVERHVDFPEKVSVCIEV
jgi:diaminopimelate epimerase